jgi:AraC-like DNA-binding protein
MKAFKKEIVHSKDASFVFKVDKGKIFPLPFLHFHDHIEIVSIEKSEGMRIIGDNISSFYPGDVVLIGTNIPHAYIFDEKKARKKNHMAKSRVIQFLPDIFGEKFLNLPENTEIKRLFSTHMKSFKIEGKSAIETGSILKKMETLAPSDRLFSLMEIVRIISRDKTKREIVITETLPFFSTEQSTQYKNIADFIMQNFKEDISCNDISTRFKIPSNTLCRNFKKNSGKTITDFINELRIEYASTLIYKMEKSITEIVFESGFSNISHFNRLFKKYKIITPSQLRKMIHK